MKRFGPVLALLLGGTLLAGCGPDTSKNTNLPGKEPPPPPGGMKTKDNSVNNPAAPSPK